MKIAARPGDISRDFRIRAEVLPKSPARKAVAYTLNHWAALLRYCEMAIDNAAERTPPGIALGRNNCTAAPAPVTLLFVSAERSSNPIRNAASPQTMEIVP